MTNTLQIREFLQDPRDLLELKNIKFDKSVVMTDSITKEFSFELAHNTLKYKDNKGTAAVLKYSVIKPNNNWPFGTNLIMTRYYETSIKDFPFKNNLKIGSSLSEFQKHFGKPNKTENNYSYYFKYVTFKSTMTLESYNDIFTKIIIESQDCNFFKDNNSRP
ncbi:hypothetical protein F0365_13195 [Nonlabens sp. Ci31]|uniref:hypothetical protein n=1 Tax=Nonlabens sp. Ci31 TaxID=2608253 RepID=UPI0014629D31|nr:hypothetical protein [Nonlabens sp. Ci31]QJP35280.1 hypothetical protein F0365_13195 [Nonlabens sp. Ci31]